MSYKLYTDFWEEQLPAIMDKLEVFPHFIEIQMNALDFTSRLKRQHYSFSIFIDNVELTNKLSNSVAAGFMEVFMASARAVVFARDKYIVIRFNRNFVLHISAMHR